MPVFMGRENWRLRERVLESVTLSICKP